MAAPTRTLTGTLAGPAGDSLAEAIELTRRLKLPYIRKAMADLILSIPSNCGGFR